jgi:two-component system sensor histidine kinase KdpD
MVEYRGIELGELDLDGLIARRPSIAIVDELAHENAPGSRHVRRWQDVEELLEKGISVWTAVNIQHLESYADVVEELTGSRVRERVPDSLIDAADEVRLIDIAPEDLIRRLEEGRIYTGGSTRAALEHFFTPLNLGALRELALRFATRAASRKLTAYARAEGGLPSESSLGETILVAVGPSPSSAHLVRWARRTAYALRADWIAVHVETGAPASAEARRRVEENLDLARRLGAEVLVAHGADVAEAVVGLARSKGVSMIVIGRSGIKLGGLLSWPASVSDRIIRDAAPIDIALVQDSKLQPKAGPLDGLKRVFAAPPRQYALLAATFASLVLLGELAAPLLNYQGIALLFLAAVLGLSMVANPGPVAALALVSAFALNFLFIPPLYTFSIGKPEDWVLFGVYFLVAFMTSALVSRLRSRQALLEDREAAAAFLFGASTSLSGSASIEEAAAAAARIAREHFSTEAFVLVDDGEGLLARESIPSLPVGERELDVAAYAYAQGAVCGSGTDTLPEASFRYLPAQAGESPSAVIGLRLPEARAWKSADDELLRSLGRSLALAIERRRSDAKSRDASLRLESERLGGILLDSVSHELRTPLTAITGSLSALREDSLAEKPEARAELLATALEAASSLDAIVEDLLSLSRIESGMLKIARRRVELCELAADAIDRAGPEARARRIGTFVPEDAEEALVDGALAARLAANLLRNAVRYSPPATVIDFYLEPLDGALAIRVRDRGPGIPEDELGDIFGKFARGRGAKGKGLGLGLAICRGIAEAHGGSISARNAEGGGLEVEAILRYGQGGSA